MNTKVKNENPQVDDVNDEAVDLFAQIADENSEQDFDKDADLDDEQSDQDEGKQPASKGNDSQNEQDADPWQSAPEALRSQFNQIQQAHNQLQQQYQAVTGRLAPTQRELEALKKQLAMQEQQKVNGKKSGPTADEIAGMTDDELEQEWPEVAAALKRRETAMMQQMQQRIQQELSPLQEMRERFQQQEVEQVKQRELGRLAQAHPDYQDVVRNPGFRDWLTKQPPAVQSIASSMSADDNIALLNLYKQANGSAGNRNAQRSGKPALRDQAEIPRKGAGRAAVDPNNADPVSLFTQIAT